MAKSKARLKELRDKIAARKAQRKAGKADKYAKMRLVAAKAPGKLEKHLTRLADRYASMAEGMENLRENLGLVRVGKEAPLKTRVAAAKSYGKKFIRIAEEAPEKLENALVEAYNGLNDIAADIEFAAEQMGVSLEEQGPMAMPSMGKEIGEPEAEIEEEIMVADEEPSESESGLEPEDEEPVVEEKEAAGSDAFSSDRDESGNSRPPENADVPRVAGTDAWVSDRDESAQPKKPAEAEIPQAKDATSKKAMSRKDYIVIADALRSFRMPNQQREDFARHLSRYLKSDNFNFNESIFVGYVLGQSGDKGGKTFKGDAPNVPDTLFA
jgi:hypothetical protein